MREKRGKKGAARQKDGAKVLFFAKNVLLFKEIDL